MDPARMALSPIATALAGSLRSALVSCTPEVQQRTRQILTGIASSVFTNEGVAALRQARALPPAIEQLATRLEALGIQSRGLGEVLKQLRALIGERAMTPERTAALGDVLNARSGSGAASPPGGADHVARAEREYLAKLSPQQRAAYLLQQQASRQAEAAALMSGLLKLHSTKDIISKIG